MSSTRTSALVLIIIAAAATRLLPHPPNVTSITALALFGGACFSNRWIAFAVPLLALAASNLVLGVYWNWSFMAWQPHLWVQYVAFAMIVALGFLLRERRSVWRVASVTLASSVLFFVVTNLAEWAFQAWYPKTADGLVAAYVAAIPFFRNSLLGDFGYVALLFGGMKLLETKFPSLRAPAAHATTAWGQT